MSSFYLDISYICSILYTHFSTLFFRILFRSQLFYLSSKSLPTFSSSSRPTFSKSPTIDRPQQSMKASIAVEQSTNFQIIIKWSIYRLIFLYINRIYNIFIFERSYKYKIRNVSTQFQYFCDHMHFSILNWLIYRTKLLFVLHPIYIYVNYWTIVQPKYNIIIYMIY